jgi:glucosylceramidase
LIVANSSGTPQAFQIRYHGKNVQTALSAGSVGTYIW